MSLRGVPFQTDGIRGGFSFFAKTSGILLAKTRQRTGIGIPGAYIS